VVAVVVDLPQPVSCRLFVGRLLGGPPRVQAVSELDRRGLGRGRHAALESENYEIKARMARLHAALKA